MRAFSPTIVPTVERAKSVLLLGFLLKTVDQKQWGTRGERGTVSYSLNKQTLATNYSFLLFSLPLFPLIPLSV